PMPNQLLTTPPTDSCPVPRNEWNTTWPITWTTTVTAAIASAARPAGLSPWPAEGGCTWYMPGPGCGPPWPPRGWWSSGLGLVAYWLMVTTLSRPGRNERRATPVGMARLVVVQRF